MKHFLAFVFAAFIPLAAISDESIPPLDADLIRPAGDSDLSEFMWLNRLIVVFADSPADPRFGEQIERLKQGTDMLRDRDVVVLLDSDPAARAPARLKLRPRGFMLVLIGKDGKVALQKPLPLTVREISRTIDKTAEREREVEERRSLR